MSYGARRSLEEFKSELTSADETNQGGQQSGAGWPKLTLPMGPYRGVWVKSRKSSRTSHNGNSRKFAESGE